MKEKNVRQKIKKIIIVIINKFYLISKKEFLYDRFNVIKRMVYDPESQKIVKQECYYKSKKLALKKDYTKILDFCLDYKQRLLFVELGKGFFIKLNNKKDDSSFLYEGQINGYLNFFLRLSKDKKKVYFKEQEDIISELDLTLLEGYKKGSEDKKELKEIKQRNKPYNASSGGQQSPKSVFAPK